MQNRTQGICVNNRTQGIFVKIIRTYTISTQIIVIFTQICVIITQTGVNFTLIIVNIFTQTSFVKAKIGLEWNNPKINN